MAETKIFVCCHGKSLMPVEYSRRPFILVGGGGYKSEFVRVSDDTGDSVWQYNRYINEATVLYWVANNYRPLPDFVGFAMYRHRLELSEGEPGAVICHGASFDLSVRKHFMRVHRGMPELLDAIKQSMPDIYDDFVSYIDTSNTIYHGNMFIAPRSDFADYATFITRCVHMVIPLIDKLGVRKSGDPRTCGYMIERLTSFWIWRRVRDGLLSLRDVRMLHYGISRIALSAAPQGGDHVV